MCHQCQVIPKEMRLVRAACKYLLLRPPEASYKNACGYKLWLASAAGLSQPIYTHPNSGISESCELW